jgi:tetratricopeptide (TPR) repeat protein
MESRSLKRRLLATVAASREREHELLAMCDDSPPPEPGLWTVKDHLAHLTEWRVYAAQVLDAVRTESTEPDLGDDLDATNARFYVANKDKTADEVKSQSRSSYETLEAAIAACSDEELATSRGSSALWQVVPGNGHYHLGEHLMFWHLEQGDEEAAEVAQQWVYDLNRAEFSEPKQVAVAAYNLASFYARVGRADEALHHFKHAFDLDPSLKQDAQVDPIVDRIRNDPGVAALIS